ncbi:unnamed protein product [Sphagnum troendelagicum]
MSQWKAKAPAALLVPDNSEDDSSHVVGDSCMRPIDPHPVPLPLHMSPLPETLLSPVDPGFLEGASSMARFGLDIGGTLCKVVFFEPLTGDASKTKKSKLPQKGSVKDGSQGPRGMSTLGNCNGGSRVGTCIECSGAAVSEGLVPVPQSTISESIWKGKNGIRRDACQAQICSPSGNGTSTDNTTSGFGGASPILKDHTCAAPDSSKEYGFLGEDSMRESSQRQARRIWISSHEPVHLPGRGTLYFKCFETWKMEEFLSLSKEHSLVTKGRVLGATGGGARKFRDKFLEIAGLQLQHADELKSLVRGIDFLARHAHHESFEYPSGSYEGGVIQRPWQENCSDDSQSDISGDDSPSSSPTEKEALQTQEKSTEKWNGGSKDMGLRGSTLATSGTGWQGGSEALYPYLVVNIGSGVSILRVDSADSFERVGGTSLGGSTFLGLASALTGCTSFEEAINLAMEGDSTQIDMLVGDIYGGDYAEMGLAATTVASSFGKLVQPGHREAAMQAPQHLAKAVLLMVTNNIGSIAMLHARAAGVAHIMFTGSFLHDNKLAMRLLTVAMNFWSKGNIKAVFLRHEGHAGAVGALLSTLELSNPIDALLLNSKWTPSDAC